MSKLKVVDFFCGAGGFSEGFRQMGFEIIYGFDCWKPATETFNHNYNLNCKTKNILDFLDSIEEILEIPDSEIIIGSPPCVSFSNSNKSGKADKSLGLKLTESFLRIVAVKKHLPNSILKAWFMENVSNSKKYLKDSYTFEDLNLKEWAKLNKINPLSIAINLSENSTIINSADYGSYQSRKRLISGEIISLRKLIVPSITNYSSKNDLGLPTYKTIKQLRDKFPTPFETNRNRIVYDPIYNFPIEKLKITDHFYDTGIYKTDWLTSRFLKVNHPYMGKMSFPENENQPSRTVTATKIGSSREALIYKSEVQRNGNGEFRTPTIREAAIIMGFPITYQFLGTETNKWRLIGNAVCPSVSKALAKTVLKNLGLKTGIKEKVEKEPNLSGVNNLNTFKLNEFLKKKERNKNSRFRRHPFKDGNMTVTLTNYDAIKNSKEIGNWQVTVFYGTGEGYGVKIFKDNFYEKLEPIIVNTFSEGASFIKTIDKLINTKVASKNLLQEMYEKQKSLNGFLEPTLLMDEIEKLIKKFDINNDMFIQGSLRIFDKKVVPKNQLYALYTLNKLISKANKI